MSESPLTTAKAQNNGRKGIMEGLSITFASNGKLEFVPRDQVFSLLVGFYSLFLHLN